MSSSRTVLLVEKNDELREATRDLLAALGNEVVAVSCGKEARRVLDGRGPVDLIVSEASASAAVELPSDHPRAGRVVLATRSESGPVPIRRRVSVLYKPFSADELRYAVEDALEERFTGEETSDVASLDEDGRRQLDQAVQRRPSKLTSALWAAAAVVLFTVAGIALRQADLGAPPLPAPSERSTVRGTTLDLLEPRGDLDDTPGELRWAAVDGAASYLVRLVAVDGEILWQVRVTTPRTKLGRTLDAGVAYWWEVEAFDRGGRRLAWSEPGRFLVRPPQEEAKR